MITYQSSVTIDRPPEAVFPYIVELSKQALWSDVQMRPITGGDVLQKDSRLELTFGKGPLKAKIGLEMTAAEPPTRTTWRTFSGPISWQGEYRLEPSGEGATKVSQQGTLEFHGLWRLLEPFVGGEIKSGEIKELEKLKAAVEGA